MSFYSPSFVRGDILKNKIFIEDNLKVLEDSLIEKESIKMIYIDPPYNTKSKLSYNDRMDEEEWLGELEKRLILSKSLLKDDGMVFLSIDDNEYAELKLLCDRIYNKKNYVGTFIVKQAQRSNSKHLNTVHEYILCYCKNKKSLGRLSIKKIDIPEQRQVIDSIKREVGLVFNKYGISEARKKLKEQINKYIVVEELHWLINYYNVDENGRIFFATDLSAPIPPNSLDIPEIGLYLDPLPTRGWQSKSKFIELHNKGLLYFRDGRPYAKHYIEDAEDNVSSILNFCSKQGSTDLKRIGLDGLFDTPKSVELLKYLIRVSCDNNDIVLDLYAGSGTTAQAVYEVNNENNLEINYYLVQSEEMLWEKSKPYVFATKNGYEPTVANALLYRIDRVCELMNIEKDYVLIKK